MDLAFLSAVEISRQVRARQVSAVEVTRHFLDRAARLDARLGCFLLLDPEGALAQAAEVDAACARGEDLPLCGVPIGIKDILCTRGLTTTAGSRILAGFVPPYDATCVERLRRAGGVVLGKLNLDEFAMGSSGENSAFGPTRNPWDPSRVPGGSSSGSAAAVSAGLCALSLGTDTGGSIRQPAALCGVSGLKPTYGRVSRHGLIAFASSLDQAGPIARSAEDLAVCLGVIAGPDPLDSTCLPEPVPDYLSACAASPAGLRIGVPRQYFSEGLEPAVERCVRQALAVLCAAGAVAVDVSLPLTPHTVSTYYLIATAEASSNLARYDGVRYGLRAAGSASLTEMYERTRAAGFGAEVRRRILLGTYALRSGYYDAYYRRASQVRRLIRDELLSALARCDLILSPTTPGVAFRLGERTEDPLAMYLSDIYTTSASLAGLPAVSIPCGLAPPADDPDGPLLPVGLQLIGPPLGESVLLRAAAAFQRLTDWHVRRPPAAMEIP
ncbi:MAG: Asp-tRNA(Asn)/Glu-tRNA(Gln) amidotransferase subunit GatA [Myxococcales bacterium]|nr:Asp-tRNA(Asn)/Glu-tRNA(Gln) amidotransferase subunit GatA [Myxococcota bacterium]MDW8283262.1 Asp-tRNA(Asn)/Glu-tRNA(Gln) amidotransferase subunit GatA [Myxococcales bacterium]